MTHVGSGGQEKFQGHLGGLGGIAEDIFGVVGSFNLCAEFVEFGSWNRELVDRFEDWKMRNVLRVSSAESCAVSAADWACTISVRGFSGLIDSVIDSVGGVCNVSTGVSVNVDWKRLEIGARRLRARSWRPG